MKKTSKTIVFFGSGPVAAESLRLLAQHSIIEAVITKPRPFHHKGAVPVLALAEQLNLKTYTVHDKKSLDVLFATKPLESRLAILIDFGIIVSQKVIDYFPLGIINSHFSLLPEWRGADPLTFSVLSGQKKTGVSLMLLTAGMDEGPLLAQVPFDMPASITTPQLTEELIIASDQGLATIIPQWFEGTIEPIPQDVATMANSQKPTYSRKLTKEDGILDWNKSAAVLEREVRAFSGWPKSRATLHGLDIVITKSHVVERTGTPGTTSVVDKTPIIFCSQNALAIDRLIPSGKKEMDSQSFLAGYKKTFLQ